MKMLFGIVAAIATAMLAAGVLAETATVTAIATVDVQVVTCGITTSSSSIPFGPVVPGTTSNFQPFSISNTGNATTASFTVAGTDWTSASGTFPVGQTKASENGIVSFIALTTTPGTAFGNIIGHSTKVMY